MLDPSGFYFSCSFYCMQRWCKQRISLIDLSVYNIYRVKILRRYYDTDALEIYCCRIIHTQIYTRCWRCSRFCSWARAWNVATCFLLVVIVELVKDNEAVEFPFACIWKNHIVLYHKMIVYLIIRHFFKINVLPSFLMIFQLLMLFVYNTMNIL